MRFDLEDLKKEKMLIQIQNNKIVIELQPRNVILLFISIFIFSVIFIMSGILLFIKIYNYKIIFIVDLFSSFGAAILALSLLCGVPRLAQMRAGRARLALAAGFIAVAFLITTGIVVQWVSAGSARILTVIIGLASLLTGLDGLRLALKRRFLTKRLEIDRVSMAVRYSPLMYDKLFDFGFLILIEKTIKINKNYIIVRTSKGDIQFCVSNFQQAEQTISQIHAWLKEGL